MKALYAIVGALAVAAFTLYMITLEKELTKTKEARARSDARLAEVTEKLERVKRTDEICTAWWFGEDPNNKIAVKKRICGRG